MYYRENVRANINNNNNTTLIDWFNFQINDFFFQLSIRFKVDQIEKAINFSEITSTSVENFHGCWPMFFNKKAEIGV